MRTPAQALTAWANDRITFVIAGGRLPHTKDQFKALLNLIVLTVQDKGGADSYDQFVYSCVWDIVNKLVLKNVFSGGSKGRQEMIDLFKGVVALPNASRFESFDDVEQAIMGALPK